MQTALCPGLGGLAAGIANARTRIELLTAYDARDVVPRRSATDTQHRGAQPGKSHRSLKPNRLTGPNVGSDR